MLFAEYQAKAQETDQTQLVSVGDLKSIIIPLLGLAGESGSLLSEYKKYLRDGDAYKVFHERISEELGDILWYIANIATKSGLELDDIARKNLEKNADRWHGHADVSSKLMLFDDDYPDYEKFPRQFEIAVRTEKNENGKSKVQLYYGGRRLGSELTDNAYDDDGYRLHDVFHLSFLAILGWSPVMRRLFNCKRKSNSQVDENEDGGRSTVIDEAIAALIFTEARKHSFFEGIDSVEYGLLRTIKDLTTHLEVCRCSAHQWETTILEGCKIWRALKTSEDGMIVGDLNARTIRFIPSNV
jgi:NTP pyrophosphatase (non-canonical NTP hydrolase)